MKEIPAGLKEYLFAMYIGQKVAYAAETDCKNGFGASIVNYMVIKNASSSDYLNSHLQLRPLSSITDDEAIEVGNIHWPHYINSEVSTPWVRNVLETISQNFRVYQYLQQQGFAMSIFYKGVQYPVEQLTDWGFIKIKA